jgi:hypothetical protein
MKPKPSAAFKKRFPISAARLSTVTDSLETRSATASEAGLVVVVMVVRTITTIRIPE